MSDSLKGLRVQATIKSRSFTYEDFAKHARRASLASQDMFDKVKAEATRQMQEHIEWVVSMATAAGYQKDDLMLIARKVDERFSYILVVDNKCTKLIGEAHLLVVHDEMQVTLKSIYGRKPEAEKS